jgi:peptide/nickel transport system permease protein
LAQAVLTESALSFLGLGVQPPAPSWGNMLTGARVTLLGAPWLALYPGLCIVIAVLCCNGLIERFPGPKAAR